MGELPSSGGSYLRDEDGNVSRIEGPTKPAEGVGPVASSGDAEDVLNALQARLKVSTDQALADALNLGRSTVTSWRRRGKVPARYARLVEQDAQERLKAAFQFEMLSEEEQAAFCLALMRMHKGFLADLQSYPEFLRRSGFIPTQVRVQMEKALSDILAEMEREDYQDARQCLNALVFAEFFE